MRFEFATATRIVFGEGCIEDAGTIAAQWGKRALVVTGRDSSRAQRLIDLLAEAGIHPVIECIDKEPTTHLVTQAVARARQERIEFVIGFGGGAALDAGKAIAALATNVGELIEYLEVVGKGQAIQTPPLPYLAIPTTSGTGSEVTKNAVLLSPEHGVKASMRHALMLPRAAVIDPRLMLTVPPEVTAATGLDALTQLLEPFVSKRSNPLTDALCREGMRQAGHHLLTACEDGSNQPARTGMALASLFGGLALANAGLGAVHGFAAVIGGMFHAPHGAICARLLAPVIRANVQALRDSSRVGDVMERYDEVGRILTGRSDGGVDDAVSWVDRVCLRLSIPRLNSYGIQTHHIEQIVERAISASSMKPNPAELGRKELAEIVESAL